MASMRDIKRRKNSIESTGQITKAMKLVSTVKLQKAKARVENAKPYFDMMYSEVTSMIQKSGNLNHVFLNGNKSKNKAIILITSNRGLAGGYNSNVMKLILNDDFIKDTVKLYAVGRKGRDLLSKRGYEIKGDYSDFIEAPEFKHATQIGNDVLEAFDRGEVGEIYIAYTVFRNTVTHVPKLLKLLPIEVNSLEIKEDDTNKLTFMNYEPAAEEALHLIIPKYINSLIYGALMEALASEHGARIQAMESATNNAEDMIEDLDLKYNRARQGAITRELTEIVAGANAINE